MRKDRQDRQDRRLVILGDLDDLGDLCSILHFFTSMIFPSLNFNILMKIKAIYTVGTVLSARVVINFEIFLEAIFFVLI